MCRGIGRCYGGVLGVLGGFGKFLGGVYEVFRRF